MVLFILAEKDPDVIKQCDSDWDANESCGIDERCFWISLDSLVQSQTYVDKHHTNNPALTINFVQSALHCFIHLQRKLEILQCGMALSHTYC